MGGENIVGVMLVGALVTGLLLMGLVSSAPQGRGRGRRNGTRGGYRPSGPPVDVKERWGIIQAMAAGGPAGLKNAINEADKLFDHVMRSQGYPGETMAERLKIAQKNLSNRDGVWRAHKLRNALAHEVGFDLVPSQAREALGDFERGLRDLRAL